MLALRLGLPMLIAMWFGVASPSEAVAAPPIHWNNGIKWVPFDQALTRAKAENRAVCVVVYADWCPKCRALAPRFAEEPITSASSEVIMVLQNSDDKPQWLRERFGDLGNYVPRVFFLKPDGSVDTTITSGNSRFPYFYRSSEADKLAASIHRAAKAAGPAQAPTPQPAAAPQPAVGQSASAAGGAAAPTAPPAAASSGGLASSSDLPLLALLAALAGGAVWFFSRGGSGEGEGEGKED